MAFAGVLTEQLKFRSRRKSWPAHRLLTLYTSHGQRAIAASVRRLTCGHRAEETSWQPSSSRSTVGWDLSCKPENLR